MWADVIVCVGGEGGGGERRRTAAGHLTELNSPYLKRNEGDVLFNDTLKTCAITVCSKYAR